MAELFAGIKRLLGEADAAKWPTGRESIPHLALLITDWDHAFRGLDVASKPAATEAAK
jgi:hypothetical protein